MFKNPAKIVLALFAVSAAAVFAYAMAILEPPLGQVAVFVLGLAFILIPVIFKSPKIGLFLVAFFLPFERIPSLEMGGVTFKIDHFLIPLVFLLVVLKILLDRKFNIPKDPIRTMIIIFIFALGLSLPIALNQGRALQVFAFMILMLLIYLIVTLVVKDKQTLVFVLKGLLLGSAVAGIFALYQFLGDMAGLPPALTLLKEGYDQSTFGFARVQAMSAEPLYFANYIFIPIFLCLLLIVRGEVNKILGRSLAIILSVTLLIDFVLTVSRGAYIAAVAAGLALIILQAKLVLTWKSILGGILILFLVAGGSYLALLKSEPRALDEFLAHVALEDREKGESVVLRAKTMTEGWEMFRNNWMRGVGLGNFGVSYLNDPIAPPSEGWPIVNNEYIEILAEGGIMAFIPFILLIILIFFRGIAAFLKTGDKLLKTILMAFLLAFFAILVQYLTFSTLYIIYIWFLIGLIGAVSNVVAEKEPR